MTSPMGYGALGLRLRGAWVFPCEPRGKRPLTEHGCLDASNDVRVVEQWWARWPKANPAIATGPDSRCWVLDIDGAEGESTLAGLEREHGALPTTAIARTGGGGRHIYFTWPADRDVRNSARQLGPGLDVRGRGGYVIAPPSVHASGERYAWLGGRGRVDAPGWLLDLVSPIERPKPQRAIAERPQVGARSGGPELCIDCRIAFWMHRAIWSQIEDVERSTEGNRNASLNRAAHALGRYVAGRLLDESEVVAHLTEAALGTGLGADETAKTIASGLAGGARDPRDRAWLESHLALRGRAA